MLGGSNLFRKFVELQLVAESDNPKKLKKTVSVAEMQKGFRAYGGALEHIGAKNMRNHPVLEQHGVVNWAKGGPEKRDSQAGRGSMPALPAGIARALQSPKGGEIPAGSSDDSAWPEDAEQYYAGRYRYWAISGSDDRTLRVWYIPVAPEDDLREASGVEQLSSGIGTARVRLVRAVKTIKAGKTAGRICCCAVFVGGLTSDVVRRNHRGDDGGRERSASAEGGEKEKGRMDRSTSEAAIATADVERVGAGRDSPPKGKQGSSQNKQGKGKDGKDYQCPPVDYALIDTTSSKGPCLYAMTGSRDQPDIHIWHVDSGKWVTRLDGHTGPVSCITAFSSGDSSRRPMALSGSQDMTLVVWELNTLSALFRLEGHTGKVECCSIFARGRFALSGSSDGTVRVWNLITGKQTKEFAAEGGHEGAISCCQPLLERYAISGGHDRTCKLWQMTGKSLLEVKPGELVTAVARKPKGDR
jgi:hypothetical protein